MRTVSSLFEFGASVAAEFCEGRLRCKARPTDIGYTAFIENESPIANLIASTQLAGARSTRVDGPLSFIPSVPKCGGEIVSLPASTFWLR